VRALVAAALLLVAGPAAADEKLVRTLGGSEIDWSAGLITARGGAAADFHLPTAELARPGAERRAQAQARARLRATLDDLPTGGRKLSEAQKEAAVARAHREAVDYQSNGGVLLTLGLGFGDVVPPKEPSRVVTTADAGAPEPARKAPERALSVASMPFELAPRLAVGERDAPVAWAIYRLGPPPAGVDAIAVHRDRAGRLVLPKGEAKALQKLAGAPVVIYVQKTPK
jgi:hypothetical protein